MALDGTAQQFPTSLERETGRDALAVLLIETSLRLF